jgi:hypothetical protein
VGDNSGIGTFPQSAEAVRIVRGLEAEGCVTGVEVNEPDAGLIDIMFDIGDEPMLVMVADGVSDARIVGRRREYECPISELAGILRDWPNFRRGWHA